MLDIHFTKFITVSWITIIWCILIALHVVVLLFLLGSTLYMAGQTHPFTGKPVGGAWMVLVWPVVVALSLLATRIFLELTIVLFRNEANTRVAKEHYLRVAKAEKYDAE